MKFNLNDDEFKRFKELSSKFKAKTLTPEEETEFESLKIKKEGKQDIDWYTKYPNLYRNSASLAFNYRPGVEMEFASQQDRKYFAMANLAITSYIPVPGRARSMNDALNIYARKLWIALNLYYRGIGVYEQSDVGVYLFCAYNVVETIAWAQRIFGIIRRYKAMNKNFPKTFADALGLDFASWNDGAALMNFLFDLNYQIERANTLFIPKEPAYLKRHVAMNSLVFLDDENPDKANMFMYEPICYWVWNPTIFNSGSAAITKPIATVDKTPKMVIGYIKEQLDALLSDQDVTRMGSDLYNILKNEHRFMFGEVPQDYKVDPIYSALWLAQWHNVETIGGVGGHPLSVGGDRSKFPVGTAIDKRVIDSLHPLPVTVCLAIYQYDNVLKFNVFGRTQTRTAALQYYSSSAVGQTINIQVPTDATGTTYPHEGGISGDGFIDSWEENPGPEVVMELSRVKVRGTYTQAHSDDQTTNRYVIEYDVIGDVICTATDYFTFYDHNNTTVATSALTVEGSAFTATDLIYITKFDWHPVIYTSTNRGNQPSLVITNYCVGDLDNFAILSRSNLEKLNEAALLSLFDLSQLIDSIIAAKSR